MSRLYIKNTLDQTRLAVFDKLVAFKHIGILAGGTAIAFQLNHRRSFDFDIFMPKEVSKNLSWEAQKVFGKKIEVERESETELTFYTPKRVKITFFHYPFKPLYRPINTGSIQIFNWKDIAADKAYTVGRRPLYRDYIDLFFVIKKGWRLEKIIKDAKKKFGGLFSEKIFLGQLTYLKDLRGFNRVEFLREPLTHQEIQRFFDRLVSSHMKKRLIK